MHPGLCPICLARLADPETPTTDLARTVAEWLIDYDTGLGVCPGESYEAQAAELLTLIGRTAAKLRRVPGEPPF